MLITAFYYTRHSTIPSREHGSGLSLLRHTFTLVVSTPFLITSNDVSRMSLAEKPERALKYVGVDACASVQGKAANLYVWRGLQPL